MHAAQKLGRQWIGIVVTHLAIGLIEQRLRDAFGTEILMIDGILSHRDFARLPGADPVGFKRAKRETKKSDQGRLDL